MNQNQLVSIERSYLPIAWPFTYDARCYNVNALKLTFVLVADYCPHQVTETRIEAYLHPN